MLSTHDSQPLYMSLSSREWAVFAGGVVAGATLLHFSRPTPVKMKRILQTTVIKKDKVEQYKKYHAAVWSVVLVSCILVFVEWIYQARGRSRAFEVRSQALDNMATFRWSVPNLTIFVTK